MQQLLSGVDWFSVKITLFVSFPCFIIGNNILVWMGALSVVSNIVYNAIRIYKEVKNNK
jgi:hypothetical protein